MSFLVEPMTATIRFCLDAAILQPIYILHIGREFTHENMESWDDRRVSEQRPGLDELVNGLSRHSVTSERNWQSLGDGGR